MKSVFVASSKTQVCASLAKSGRTSHAPFMHNVAFQHLGLDYVYVSFEPDDIGKAIEAIRALGLPGGSVSVPYKEQVMKHLDDVDSTARSIGAVNAYVNNDGQIIGYNSDWIGAIQALEEVTGVRGKRVAIVGAGGVARAIVFGLLDREARVTIFNRTKERGEKLAHDFNVKFGGNIENAAIYKPEILINATSVGKDNIEILPLDESIFKTTEVAMDVTSNPLQTAFLKSAESYKCKVVTGLRMSVLQAAFTFRLITGQEAPVELMYETAYEQLTNVS